MLKNKSTPLKCWPIYCFKSKIYTGIELKTFDFSNDLFDFFGGWGGGILSSAPPVLPGLNLQLNFEKEFDSCCKFMLDLNHVL